MKSHDFHIWIEQLLPLMVRGYVLEHVWKVLAKLSFSSANFVLRRYL
jgi:hypothetical protein